MHWKYKSVLLIETMEGIEEKTYEIVMVRNRYR